MTNSDLSSEKNSNYPTYATRDDNKCKSKNENKIISSEINDDKATVFRLKFDDQIYGNPNYPVNNKKNYSEISDNEENLSNNLDLYNQNEYNSFSMSFTQNFMGNNEENNLFVKNGFEIINNYNNIFTSYKNDMNWLLN
jgi:hypothetical protein